MPIETIAENGQVFALILRRDFSEPGLHFFTPNEFSQQLAYMHHPAGKVIQPHRHNPVRREVVYTQEVLFVRSGKVRVDFYRNDQIYLESRTLNAGDVILLASAGHGFEVLEDAEIIEVKQGPYVEQEDKVKFSGISAGQAIFKESQD